MNISCIFICIYGYLFILLHAVSEYLFMSMHTKNEKLAALKVLISSAELGSQEEVLQAMAQQGYSIPQASLSRYLKQLGVPHRRVSVEYYFGDKPLLLKFIRTVGLNLTTGFD